MSADALDADEVARAKITRSVADRSSCLWLARGTRWLSFTLNHEGALTDLRRRPMSKKAYAIAVAALLGAPPIAFAAQPANHHAAGQSQGTIQPDQMLASKMIGSRVYDLQNRNIGKVRDLIVDRDGMIDFVIVDVGTFLGMGGKRVPVKLNDFKTDNSRLTLDVTKEQLQRMADYWVRDRNTGVGSSTPPVHGGNLGSGR
jgi:hypothetical protein